MEGGVQHRYNRHAHLDHELYMYFMVNKSLTYQILNSIKLSLFICLLFCVCVPVPRCT